MSLEAGRDADEATPSRGAAATAPARPAAIALAVLLAAIFLAVFLSRFTPAAIALERIAEPLAGAAVVVLAAYAAGVVALGLAGAIFRRLARLPSGGRPFEPAAILLVGLPAFGTLVALVAWTGVAIDLLISLLALVLAAAGALLSARRERPARGRLGAWDVALLGPPIAIAVLGALSPVNSPDELIYKLAVPKAYLLFGGMIDLPLNSQSYLSTALSSVSLAGLALSGGVAAKLIHAALFVAVLAEVRRLGERLHPGSGPWVAAVAAWTPALMLIAGWAWSEWAILGLLLLSYRGWLDFQSRPTSGACALVMASLAGAMAIKYTALPWLAAFALVAVARLAGRGEAEAGRLDLERGDREGRSWREVGGGPGRMLAAAALVLFALGAFFYLRNWIWSGSPVAPFLLADAPAVERYRTQGELAGWQELLLGYDIVHSGIVDDALGILLPACALLAPLGALRIRAARDLFWIGLLPLPFLVFLSPLSRLLLTSVVPLAVVGAAYLARCWPAVESAILRGLVAACAALALAAQLLLVLWVIVTSYEPFGVVLGAETEAEYSARMRPYTAAYAWVEHNTPPQSRVFLIGENRSFALERATYSAGNFDGDRLARFLGRHADATAFAGELRRLGVTHVVVHWPWLRVEGRARGELGMLEREFVLPLPQTTARMLQDLVDRIATRRYQDDAYSVYELPADGAAADSTP